ncbi:protein CHUP1, chloroplastic-like [Miscanthus floridulus]|uniref:protein CHUP1, chloroplastic-like n=1 Tax=Miscanthus floridulus TaxID=154761 RepID=UPI0034581344
MESKNAESIKNLLLKIVFPLAFPLAGAFICDLITNRANRHSSYTDSSGSSFQLEQSLGSICEEEEEEMESTRRAQQKLARTESACSTAGRLLISELARQASNAEAMVVEATEDPSETAAKNQIQDYQRTETDEIASLKLMVSALEDRACAIEAQFHEYCNMKEQESAYQKMQIMCLGMKLELLESQNQRLEAAAAEIRAGAEEFAAMRGKLDRLQGKFKTMSKRSKQDSDAVGERIVALDVKHAQMARRCEEFEQAMEEMKQLTVQLMEQKGANNENVEVAVERSLRKLSSGRDLVDGLEALRDRWAAGMEEMIYLGWITAWLQHDLMLIDDDYGGSTYGGDDDDEDGVAPRHPPEELEGETMVASVPPCNQVELCKAGSVSSSGSGSAPRRSVEIEPRPASCMGFAAAASGGRCRDGSGGWSIGRPRLLRKLRGWAAGGKAAGGSGKTTRCRIVGPCCQK